RDRWRSAAQRAARLQEEWLFVRPAVLRQPGRILGRPRGLRAGVGRIPLSFMKRWIERFGGVILSGLAWIGGATRLAIRTAQVAVKRPIGFRDIAVQLVELGIRSLPISSFLSLFIGMILTWQFGWGLADFGATMALGYASSLALVRELIPTFLAITVGAKMAAGMAAELGSMKVTEQIDAVSTLGADPIKKLVWPRVCGSTLAMPLLVVWGNAVALV